MIYKSLFKKLIIVVIAIFTGENERSIEKNLLSSFDYDIVNNCHKIFTASCRGTLQYCQTIQSYLLVPSDTAEAAWRRHETGAKKFTKRYISSIDPNQSAVLRNIARVFPYWFLSQMYSTRRISKAAVDDHRCFMCHGFRITWN